MSFKINNINLITTIMFQVMNVIYGFVLPKTLILNYGSDINGLISASIQIIGYMKIVEAGLTTASIRQFYKPIVDKNTKKINDLFQSITFYYKRIANYFMLLSLIGALIYSLIVKTPYNMQFVFLVVMILALSTYLEFYFTTKYYVYFLANKKIYKFQIAQITIQLIKILIVVIGSQYTINILLLLTLLTSMILLQIIILKILFIKEKVELSNKYKLIKIEQTGAVLGHQILGMIIYNGPLILISILINSSAASVFALYNMIYGTFYSFYTLVYGQTLLPQLGHNLAENKINQVNELHNKYNKYGVFALFILLATTIIMIEPFLGLYLQGADIGYFYHSTAFLFLFYTLMNCMKVPYQTLINANGDFRKTLVFSLLESSLFVFVVILFINNITINTFVIALFISSLFKLIGFKIYVNKNILKESNLNHFNQVIVIILTFFIARNIPNFISEINNIIEWILFSSVSVITLTTISIIIIISLSKVHVK